MPKQVDLTSVFVTTAALPCQHVSDSVLLLTSGCKSAPAQCTYKHCYYLVPPQSLPRK